VVYDEDKYMASVDPVSKFVYRESLSQKLFLVGRVVGLATGLKKNISGVEGWGRMSLNTALHVLLFLHLLQSCCNLLYGPLCWGRILQ